ncbi:MAG: hypothetical protein AVDCRST_MAG15-3165, partial [uncultured Rubellimicrobium sp.]
ASSSPKARPILPRSATGSICPTGN